MPIAVQVRNNPGHFPRAWIVHDILRLPELKDNDPAAMAQRSADVLQDGNQPRDFRHQAVVESDLPTVDRPTGKNVPTGETCRIAHYDPLRVEVEAELAEPGLVVLSDQFYPGWRLSVASDNGPPHEAPIVRTNRVMRGAWLPAGSHRLVYQYRPASFLLGAAFSGLGLVLSALLMWRKHPTTQCPADFARTAGSSLSSVRWSDSIFSRMLIAVKQPRPWFKWPMRLSQR